MTPGRAPARGAHATFRFARDAALAALLVSLLAATPARPGTEEFSTFSVERQELDDESLIDHMLTRTPAAWEDEWARAPQALRTRQGCLTAGQWFTETDLKLRAPMGEKAWFGFGITQLEDDRVDVQYLDFSFHFPMAFGVPFAMFRPFHDKSRQDFALGLDVGADTSAFQMSAVMGLEDLFNNLWAFRQTQLGESSQPYLKHPFEPALRLAFRQPAWRAEAGGKYLTPGTKKIIVSYAVPDLDHVTTLWGTYAWGTLGARALGTEWTVSAVDHQAASGEWIVDQPALADHDFRRQWWLEAVARRPVGRRWRGEARWLYQERSGNVASPTAPRMLQAFDRVVQAEALYSPRANLTLRVGGMRDRIGIEQHGVALPYSEGTRWETRAYVGLATRFGRVSVQGVEGIELDHEPYVVSWVHDKGFLQLQTTF